MIACVYSPSGQIINPNNKVEVKTIAFGTYQKYLYHVPLPWYIIEIAYVFGKIIIEHKDHFT